MMTRTRGRSPAFTLIESLICMTVVLMLGLGIVSCIVFTRQSLELDKQRLAAINYCRQSLEAVQTRSSIDAGSKPLVLFCGEGRRIDANVAVEFHPLQTDGTVDWNTMLKAPLSGKPTYCRVSVHWTPSGSWSRPQQISIPTLVRAGTK